MNYLEIALPIVLLALAFLLKLLIDRSTTLPVLLESVFELPVDVAFLAMSFAIAFTIWSPSDAAVGLFHFCIYLICTIIDVVLWRRAVKLFETNHYGWSAILAIANYGVSITILAFSINLFPRV